MSDIEGLTLCDCCGGLFETCYDAGGHMRCRQCTESDNATAEIERMQAIIKAARAYLADDSDESIAEMISAIDAYDRRQNNE